MSPVPSYTADRWKNRPEPAPAHGILYWHILLGDNPAVQAIADVGLEKLASFSGLHFTPRQWLHITTLVVGHAESYSNHLIEAMVNDVTRLLSDVSPITVSLGSVLYHPEAIALRVQPDTALHPIYAAVRAAKPIADETVGSAWKPHVTLAYSTSVQEAQPIIDALGYNLPPCEVVIDHINLVVQEGSERLWNWRSIAEVNFGKEHGSKQT